MIGPPSGAGTCGTAAAKYVPTNPHIRIEILIACFIGFLLSRLGLRKISFLRRGGIIRHESSPLYESPGFLLDTTFGWKRCRPTERLHEADKSFVINNTQSLSEPNLQSTPQAVFGSARPETGVYEIRN